MTGMLAPVVGNQKSTGEQRGSLGTAGLGHFLPSLSPATSDCLRFVSSPLGGDELMTVYGTSRPANPAPGLSVIMSIPEIPEDSAGLNAKTPPGT